MEVLESPGKVLDFLSVKEWEPCNVVNNAVSCCIKAVLFRVTITECSQSMPQLC